MNDNNLKNKEIDSISIREIIFLLRKNYRVLLLSLIASFFFSFLFLLATLPTYISTGKIFLEEDTSRMNPLLEMAMGKEKNFVENEIELLTSRTVSEKTIDELIKSGEKLYLLRTKKGDDLVKNSIRTLFFLNIEVFDDIESVYTDSLEAELIKELRENWTIENIPNTEILNVSYESNDPDEAALIVNTLISVYQQQDKKWENNELIYLQNFLDTQLKIKSSELLDVETKLKTFQEQNKIFALDKDSEIILEQLKTIEAEYFASDTELNILNERKKYYINTLNDGEKSLAQAITNTLNNQLFVLRNELGILEAEYISTLSLEGENHPALKDLKTKIDNLKMSIEKQTTALFTNQIASSNPIEYRQALVDSLITLELTEAGMFAKRKELKKQVDNYESQLKSLPEKYLVLSRLERDRIILEQTYSLMKQRFEEARISEASQLGKVKIIDPAVPIYKKATPRTGLILLIASFFSIVFGILGIAIKEFFDNTIKSIEEIEARGLSILAIIPNLGSSRIKQKKIKPSKTQDSQISKTIERRLILHEDPKSPISEAYRALRTSILLNSDEKISLLFTSSGPGEGKSTTCMNLAITYANLGKKVIICDTDLRKPVVHKVFNMDKNHGITTFITKGGDIDNYIQKTDTENLSVLCAGPVPPNPSEILGSIKFKELMTTLKDKFDVVILDTPPLIAVTDAFITAKYVDQLLLVIRSGVTHKGALDRSITNLTNNEIKIYGSILNAASEATSYGGGYYYDYYQYYYGNDEKDRS